MRLLCLVIVVYSAQLTGSIRTSLLRAKRDLGDFDPVVQSIAPSLDSLDSYSGIAFDPTTTQFSVDVGSTAQTLNAQTTKANNDPVLTAVPVTDFGMASTIFSPPATSYSAPLAAFTPTAYTVLPCAPTSDNGGCLQGTPAYNLGLTVQTFSR